MCRGQWMWFAWCCMNIYEFIMISTYPKIVACMGGGKCVCNTTSAFLPNYYSINEKTQIHWHNHTSNSWKKNGGIGDNNVGSDILVVIKQLCRGCSWYVKHDYM